MYNTIHLPNRLYADLVQHSEKLERTPDQLVMELIQQFLDENEATWRTRFQALLKRIHQQTESFSPEEIEADITLAAQETKELRRARRSA
jgi:predicted DNA-binding protein